jgi:AraC-like DNA-binding protein
MAMIDMELADATVGARQFFQTIFEEAPRVATVRKLSEILGVVPSTLMSRFFRHELPAPKQYLALARLACAAQLLENSGFSISAVALQLDYSSPQSFGRHVRALMRMTPTLFRDAYDGEGMLEHFRIELIRPYRTALKRFDPLAN